MSGHKLQILIEQSHSLALQEKLSLAEHLLSDLSNQNIILPQKLSSKHILVHLPDSPVDPPTLDLSALAAQALIELKK